LLALHVHSRAIVRGSELEVLGPGPASARLPHVNGDDGAPSEPTPVQPGERVDLSGDASRRR
jgi:hypothetical protein